MKRILISVLTLTICLLGISPQSQSVEPNKSEFIEWNLGYWWLMFGVSGSHNDIQNYFPWYNYDPENSPYISSQAPLSIRIPKSIILDFADKDCINIPIQIRREVPKSVVVDESNILNLEFYPLRLNLSSQTIFSESPIYKLGPNSWNSDSKVVEVQLPACKNLIGTSKKSLEGSYINLSFVHKYSRNLNSLNGETSKCMQIISDKCVFTVQSSGSIDLVVNNDRVVLLPELYNSKIKELQDYLDSKPCYPGGIGEQLDANIYCANARDNIQLLNNELPAIKEAAAKFVPISKPTPAPTPAPTPTKSSSSGGGSNESDIGEDDGVEEEPYAELIATKTGSRYLISITSNLDQESVQVRATKKGSSTIKFDKQTNSDGNLKFTTTRKLSGYTLTVYLDGDKLNSIKVK
jgi:hypothetical protein